MTGGRHETEHAGEEKDGVEIIQVFGVVFELLLGQRFGVRTDGSFP